MASTQGWEGGASCEPTGSDGSCQKRPTRSKNGRPIPKTPDSGKGGCVVTQWNESAALFTAFRNAFTWLVRVRRLGAASAAQLRNTIVRPTYPTVPDEHTCLAPNFLPHPTSC